jgi:wobble nucleotide-excising tRNase
MIESMTIASVATFGTTPVQLNDLSKFNFFFGSNGAGKTTVSRVIAEEANFPTCRVAWKAGTKLQPLVYNRDFVDRNFNQSADLKGVFTLGEKHVEILTKVATAKSDLDALTTKIEELTQGLDGADGKGGKRGELAKLEEDFKVKCFAQKQKHDAKLQGGFERFRSSAENFKVKVLSELELNDATLLTLSELERKAEVIFGLTLTEEARVPSVDAAELIAHEANPVLAQRVLGRDDVDVAAMIKKLGNSDWVREGRRFYEASERVCPFCQRSTDDALAQSLNEYFDETFIANSKAIENLAKEYATETTRLQQQLASVIAAPHKFLDVEKLKVGKELLDARLALNNQRIAGKMREPSSVVELESVSEVFAAIKALIDTANNQVGEHNTTVANIDSERKTLTKQVWRFILEELKADITEFQTTKDGLVKAISALTTKLSNARADQVKKEAEIRELEKQTTSIQPTIDDINGLLSSFGFQGFKLAKAASGNSYKLVRQDGSDAKATLSEGEKTFVTFLYFYHLLKGSESDSGMTTDRIVVFDDPVSSLDSEILFIVASLIKALFDEVRAGAGHIKQIFVLTHNVYFHKEVTYNPNRKDVARNDETFWIVRKPALLTMVDKHPTNPIKTSYELLWAEVRNTERSSLAIQNTLRRILENYFKILGGINLERLCALFDGRDRVVCKSLCSWMHDGSHYAHDDLYVSIDDSMVNTYLRVFKDIFDKSGHSEHYKMMMGDSVPENTPVAATV